MDADDGWGGWKVVLISRHFLFKDFSPPPSLRLSLPPSLPPSLRFPLPSSPRQVIEECAERLTDEDVEALCDLVTRHLGGGPAGEGRGGGGE
jgi:hypothetical protein